MLCGHSTTQNTRSLGVRLVQGTCHMMVVGFIGGLMLISPPISTWAAVHQCVDKTGKTVLTNRPTGFRHCRVIVEDTVAGAKTAAGKKSQDSTEQTDSEVVRVLPDGLIPMPQPGENGYPRTDTPDNPPLNPSSASAPEQPCPPGINRLNPLSDVPCNLRGDPQSGGMAAPR